MNTAVIIHREKFLDWLYNEKEEKIDLANAVIERLKRANKFQITIDNMYYGCTYIPQEYVQNIEAVLKSRGQQPDNKEYEIEPLITDTPYFINY